jgi:Zn-dependent peptidase ImmA (M78 family)
VKKISRINLADFDSPEQIVQGIIKLIPDLPIPVPVEELARMLDISDIQALETEGFEGGLLTNIEKSEGIILVNQASPFQRRRFTIAHELAHFLCPRHIPQGDNGFLCSSDDMRLISARAADRTATMEVEANRFSALLLMPLPHFRKDIRLHVGADIDYILELAKRYQTSKEATARRYVYVQDEPCAVIVSHKGSILRFYRDEDFPFIDLNSGDPVPGGSLTAKTDLKLGVVSDQEERDGALWLSVRYGRRAPTIYEQVLPQRDGYRLTLITLADDPEEVEEDAALEESWTPRFKR